MVGESGATRNIFDEIPFSDIRGVQMEGESGATGSIIDDLHF